LKNIIKEPLFHFLLLGGLLYYFYTLNAVDDVSPINKKEEIYLSKEKVDLLSKEFEKEYEVNATKDIVSLLILKEQNRDVLLKEAYKLKLYKDDKKIDDILLKKMNFIINAAINSKEPSEKILREYYEKNIKDYSQKETMSFYIIEFHHLSKQKSAEFYTLIKPLKDFHTVKQVKSKTAQEHKDIYGTYFADKITKLKKGTWSKALPTKSGMAFIYISDYRVLQPYLFDEVEERVYEDYKKEQRVINYEKRMQAFESAYKFQIEK